MEKKFCWPYSVEGSGDRILPSDPQRHVASLGQASPELNWRPDLTCPDTGYSPSLVICLYSCLHISPAPILMSVIRHAAPHTSVNVNIQFANYYLSKFQNKFNPKHIWPQQFCVRNCAPSFSHLKSDKPNMEMAGDLIRAT